MRITSLNDHFISLIIVKKNIDQSNPLSTQNEGENASKNSRKCKDAVERNTDDKREDFVQTAKEPSDKNVEEVNAVENEPEESNQKLKEGKGK